MMKNQCEIFLVIVGIGFLSAQGIIKQCPDYQIHFEKILGYRPPLPASLYDVKVLHKSYQVLPTVINLQCMEMCRNDHNCESYVLNFNKSECYGFTNNDRVLDNLNYRRADDNELVEDIGVIYFVKTCLSIPLNCKSTLWPLLRIPGASLIGRGYLTINKLITRRECTERCFFETSFKCRSVSFQISQRNNIVRMGLANILNKDVMGRCIMSRDDKNMEPDSFRVAPLSDEYIENNCQVVMNGENEQFLDDLCAYEHFPGSALIYAEHLYIGLSDRQCQERCFKENKFFCKGITYQRFDRADNSRCFIHSEDILSIGPRAIIAMANSYYLKRVQCLNLNVRCTQTDLIIRYNPRNFFQGRIYADNHPECGVTGSTHGPTFLNMQIGTEPNEQKCGISRAFDYESANRTLIFVYIIIQQNPLVQMQSDRYIKVGCISHFNRIGSSTMPDVSLETSVAFNGKNYDGTGSLVIDKNFECPKLNIYTVDPFTDEVIKEARIGQILKFIISMESQYDHYDLRAINLTASSEYDRLDLINPSGCPVNPSIFPVLQPEKTFTSRRLVTKFKAFKFATSPQVKFTVIIQFCHGSCIPINCGYGIVSYGRKKRETTAAIVNKSPSPPSSLEKITFPDETTSAPPLDPIKFPEPPSFDKLIGVRTDTFGNPQGVQQYFGGLKENEVPDEDDVSKNDVIKIQLAVTLNVLEPDASDSSDRFVVGENDQILVGSLSSSSSNFCLDESLIIAIIIFLLIFQVLIILGCCIMVQRYRKMSAYDDDRSSFNNSSGLFYPDSLDNRHVRWADQRSIHDTYFQ